MCVLAVVGGVYLQLSGESRSSLRPLGERPAASAIRQQFVDTTIGCINRRVSTSLRQAGRSCSCSMAGRARNMAVAAGLLVGWLLTRSLGQALGAEPAELSVAVARVADGDLSQSLSAPAGDTTSVLANVARMQSALHSVVSAVRSGSVGAQHLASQARAIGPARCTSTAFSSPCVD